MAKTPALITAIKIIHESTHEALKEVSDLLAASEAIIKAFEASCAEPKTPFTLASPEPEESLKVEPELKVVPERAKVLTPEELFLIKKYNIYSLRKKAFLKEFVDKEPQLFSDAAKEARKRGYEVTQSYSCLLGDEALRDGILINTTPHKTKFRKFKLAPAINDYLKEQEEKKPAPLNN